MKILGIESTCDETAAAVVSFDGEKISRTSSPRINLLSSVVHSQIDIHAQFGGVIPEVAARSHIEFVNPVVNEALAKAGVSWAEIDGVAVSFAPGLNGSLLVGNLAASFAMRLPSVVALRSYVKPTANPAFTRFNLFLRDRFSCQYCGDTHELTFDHVVPRSQGGRTTWSNVTTACAPCNLKKGGRTPTQAHMHLHQPPFRPTAHHLHENGRAFPPHHCHESWRDYLYWNVELEA